VQSIKVQFGWAKRGRDSLNKLFDSESLISTVRTSGVSFRTDNYNSCLVGDDGIHEQLSHDKETEVVRRYAQISE